MNKIMVVGGHRRVPSGWSDVLRGKSADNGRMLDFAIENEMKPGPPTSLNSLPHGGHRLAPGFAAHAASVWLPSLVTAAFFSCSTPALQPNHHVFPNTATRLDWGKHLDPTPVPNFRRIN